MKRFTLTFFLALSINLLFANLLYDITDGRFRAKSVNTPRSMSDGEHFSLMPTSKAVVKYNFKTGAVVDTIFSISRLKKSPIKSISGYEFSPNEAKLLVYTNVKYRYRRTFTADYYVYDIKRNELTPLSENGSQEVPLFSPDSRYIAFARENNLYMKKLDFNTEIAITKDGKFGSIINGTPDWVYEEEFEDTRYFEWSPDSKLLAFVKFDETKVPEYSFPLYIDNTKEKGELTTYPSTYKYKYPKAGENNSLVSVCVYDDYLKSIKTVKLGDDSDQDFYIPRIKWTNSPDQLAIFKLNRNQNRLDMILANPKSLVTKLCLREEDKYYVDYENIDFIRFSSDNLSFIGVSEKDGYRHVYLYSINGVVKKQLTKGKWDVTDVYGFDEKKQVLYYQSAEASPMQRDVYAIDTKGKKTRLTDGKGTHNASFNSTFTYFVDNASSVETPNIYTLRTNTGAAVKVLENNAAVAADFKSLNLPKKEFFEFTTSENVKLNGWMVKPLNFDPNKKYPVLQVQYSGPNSQQVLDSWKIDWEYYLATKDYVVVCVDGRGTGARGAEFRKCTYQQLNILETKDQVETAKYLAQQSYIDKDRIGIWGWSYGGTMTLFSMTTGEKVFKAGIAVAPVTDFRLYDTAYAERYMRRPQENFKGYDQSSALLRAGKLEGNLLIIHGSADDNVHAQNTMLFIDKLVAADKQFEMQFYTDKNHSILGKQTRRHLYTRMSEFLFRSL
ncbi:dipeptidyl-peptidase IV [Paludibacter propionicigenes WB4]|uniref:Dipeptidyl-peptidase IV n=1 Tax=Paludibacter propionicigenes (strain DSM 17365 / JCM 13257 / WB4) TaxID=694427 RepID=E4T0I0_PALPW|nr:S9 family peptidase [Paludibacter propionicigenes]ADQ78339.1 dipeptidyl-peptidase IV [Paludibacter propionicigenes WB4]